MSRRPPPDAGFTLLEVLVALAILSIAIVACIEGFAQGLRLLKLAGDHQEAMLLADQKMREVVTPNEGRETSIEGRFAWERVTRVVAAPDLVPAEAPPRYRMYEIDVRVSWDPRRQVEIRTLRTVPVVLLPDGTIGPAPPSGSNPATGPGGTIPGSGAPPPGTAPGSRPGTSPSSGFPGLGAGR